MARMTGLVETFVPNRNQPPLLTDAEQAEVLRARHRADGEDDTAVLQALGINAAAQDETPVATTRMKPIIPAAGELRQHRGPQLALEECSCRLTKLDLCSPPPKEVERWLNPDQSLTGWALCHERPQGMSLHMLGWVGGTLSGP